MTQTPTHTSTPPWSLPEALLAVFAAFAAMILGTTLGQLLFGGGALALMIGWSIGMMLTTLYVLVTRRTPAARAALALRPSRTPIVIVLLLGLGVAISLDIVGLILAEDGTLAVAELFTLQSAGLTGAGWIAALVFLVLLQPVGEELVFRGMLLPAALPALGLRGAVIAVAVVQAAFHFLVYPPAITDPLTLAWYGALLPFLDGVFLNVIRVRTGSTYAAIAAHAALGLFAVLKVLAVA